MTIFGQCSNTVDITEVLVLTCLDGLPESAVII